MLCNGTELFFPPSYFSKSYKLFGKSEKPDYSDYRNIKTYEDACASLGIYPITDFGNDEQDEIAYKKLKTISRALWGKDFEPIPDAEGSRVYYYPLHALYTQDEIDRMDADDRGSLLSARAGVGASAGFGYLRTNARSSHSSASIGFRLCQETAEKAKYFGRQFIRIWADYLKFNFEIKED
jgi:hypothetical protein